MNKLKVAVLTGLGWLVLLAACQPETVSTGDEAGAAHPTDETETSGHGEAHTDHEPRHDGTFFMAFNEIHHLEGSLTEPGLFRVYLYDEFTQPLPSERLSGASGTLHWGQFPDPPAMKMTVNVEQSCLEVELDREVAFPLILTALIYFPGRGN